MRKNIALVAVISIVTLTGCQVVVAGRRCAAGASPARDATHVLFCVNGRWKRVVTIGQAAQIVVGNLPGSLTAASATATARAGGGPTPVLAFTARKRNGQPLANANVTLRSPATGPGLQQEAATQATDADGLVRFDLAAVRGSVGTSQLTAELDGTAISTTVSLTVAPGSAYAIAVVSGANQSAAAGALYAAPVVVKVTDFFGNAVPDVEVFFEALNAFTFGSRQGRTGADGTFSTTVTAPASGSGSQLLAVKVLPSSPQANFNLTVS